jgi:hypothetical protein
VVVCWLVVAMQVRLVSMWVVEMVESSAGFLQVDLCSDFVLEVVIVIVVEGHVVAHVALVVRLFEL